MVLERRRLTLSELARKSDLVPSTLTRFFNDPENIHTLGTRTIAKLERGSGISFEAMTESPLGIGLQEAEAHPYEPAQTPETGLRAAISNYTDGRNTVVPWELRSRALEAAGYRVGDILMLDMSAEAADGDIVCAQIYDRSGSAETVFRILEHPFLVAAPNDASLIRPVLIDGRVVIKGPVTASFRGRGAKLAS